MTIKSIHAIVNPTLLTQFVHFLKLTETRYISDPDIFRDSSWRKKDDVGRREVVYKVFLETVANFNWNNEERMANGLSILAAIHGTSLEIAWKVAEKGFVAISKVDKGY